MERNLILLFFAILPYTLEKSSEHQTWPQKVTDVFKTYAIRQKLILLTETCKVFKYNCISAKAKH